MGELVISVALMAVVIVITIGLFVRLMTASTKGVDQTVALDIAQNKLDQAAGSPANKWKDDGQENHYTTDARAPTTFYYHLTHTELTDSTNPRSNKMGDMYRLDMDVYWWPEQVGQISTRTEMGKLSVRLSRIVYIENMKP